jgi:L-amino acid N-acyltransferase YncA
MKKRRGAVLDLGLPHLVAERDGRVMGYAYAGNWRPRPAYRYSVEDSIYIDKDAMGQGAGKLLLPALIEHCTALGKRQMVAVIGDSAQTASIRLHASCGFEMTGTLKSIGFKFGRWLDSVLMQRPLGVGDGEKPG